MAAPHKCSQVDSYNLPPTIFNTLMFGIDQTKVSNHVRESFSKLNANSSQASLNQQPNNTSQISKKEEEKQPAALQMRRKSSKSLMKSGA